MKCIRLIFSAITLTVFLPLTTTNQGLEIYEAAPHEQMTLWLSIFEGKKAHWEEGERAAAQHLQLQTRETEPVFRFILNMETTAAPL